MLGLILKLPLILRTLNLDISKPFSRNCTGFYYIINRFYSTLFDTVKSEESDGATFEAIPYA